jgi:hypothetical protein
VTSPSTGLPSQGKEGEERKERGGEGRGTRTRDKGQGTRGKEEGRERRGRRRGKDPVKLPPSTGLLSQGGAGERGRRERRGDKEEEESAKLRRRERREGEKGERILLKLVSGTC